MDSMEWKIRGLERNLHDLQNACRKWCIEEGLEFTKGARLAHLIFDLRYTYELDCEYMFLCNPPADILPRPFGDEAAWRALSEWRHPETNLNLLQLAIVFKALRIQQYLWQPMLLQEQDYRGKPAYEMAKTDPDWAPTLKLGHKYGKQPSSRGLRQQAKQDREKKARAAQRAETRDIGTIEFDMFEEHHLVTVCTQTDLSFSMISSMEEELKNLKCENEKLKSDGENGKFNEKYFDGNDEKVKYFTGLPTFTTLMMLFEFIQPCLCPGSKCLLSPFEMFILTFIRLRFNLPFQLLGYIMKLSRTTVSSYFHTVIEAMFVRMQPLIIWPQRDVLRATQPIEFRYAFGGRIAVIIDCFEIFIETPSDLVARAQTFSKYKHHNTVKYLIGITPAGAISYISRGWGGRTSDRYITQHSDFPKHLVPGDVILADRGFNIADVVAQVQAEVKIPAFTKGKAQLSAYEVESTRKIAHLRIHVERVLGSMCGKYNILNGVIPVEMLTTVEGEKRCILDKIVTVCCALVNMSKSVVSQK